MLKINLKNKSGITLIALIITIIVLLILAGITISAITGTENAMQKAQQAKKETDDANELEEIKLAVINAMVNGTDGRANAGNLKTALTGVIDNTNGITGNGPWTITGKSGATYKISGSGQVEKQVSQLENNLAPGIYDENNQVVWTWEEFLQIGFWKVDANGSLEPDYTLLFDAMENGTMTMEESYDYLSGYSMKIKKAIIPDGVKGIGSEAFGGCGNLISVKIPNSVTSIDSRAFDNCASLSSIEIPSSVTSIGDSAFIGCTNLSSIRIHKDHNSISGAFWGATAEDVTIVWDDISQQPEI